MKLKVLASGSKGNVTYVEENDTKILIDFGMPSTYVEEKLKAMNVSPKEIDAILITHTHKDHTLGLHAFTKKYNTLVYISEKMDKEIDVKNKAFITRDISIKNITVSAFKTSHDVPSFGYIINDELVYITDTGYINEKYFDTLKNKKIYIMESNHDIERLMDGPYPYYLKQRILSDKGHLSNDVSSEYLSKLIGNKTEYVVLAHLSETNNLEELALDSFKKRGNDKKIKKVVVAHQREATELIEV